MYFYNNFLNFSIFPISKVSNKLIPIETLLEHIISVHFMHLYNYSKYFILHLYIVER